jgi:hypothetical protein
MLARKRKRRWVMVATVGGAVLALGLVLFKPWLLFVDVRVDEQLPTVAASAVQLPSAPSAPSKPPSGTITKVPAGPVQLAEGSLISHEHATSGTVRIIREPGGKRVLTLEKLDTSNGPDVHVWLSAADVVEGTA